MWSAAIDNWKYRPPYLAEFFEDVALRLPLTGREDLLDLACGTGNVALGFAPYVASVTGVEPEAELAAEIARRARDHGRAIRVVQSKAEDAPADLGPFDLITIGQAHWYLHQPATHARIEHWLRPGGCVLLCLPSDKNVGGAKWHDELSAIRGRWERGNLRERMALTPEQFFAGTPFQAVDHIATYGQQTIDLDHLVNRVLGYGASSRAIMGADAEPMIAEIRAAMAPYFRNGPLVERLATVGIVYRRRTGTT